MISMPLPTTGGIWKRFPLQMRYRNWDERGTVISAFPLEDAIDSYRDRISWVLSMNSWVMGSWYREGQIIQGSVPSALAISHSPFGHGRVRALASVEELRPAWRETAAKEVPRLRSAAIMSAGCQSANWRSMTSKRQHRDKI